MNNDHDTAASATIAPERLRDRLEELMGRVAGCFPRRETRSTFRELTEGLLMELEDVNCWTLAEAVGHRGPHRLQHLLSRASWDDRQVLDRAAAWAVESLDDGEGILIVDETGDEKSSIDAVGAGPQYSGSLGGVGVCQVAVHLSFASSLGHMVIDRALYLPGDWAADEERRELTGVPEEVAFASKPALAAALLTRAVTGNQVKADFFAADEVYGSRALRRTCRTLRLGYAIAVRANHKVTTPGGAMTCTEALKLVPAPAWQRMRTGSKGARDYDWAMLDVVADDIPEEQSDGGMSVLLARRHRYTGTVSFFRCWSPDPAPLSKLVQVVCFRWKIEEDFQTAKNTTGLDKGQVTTWTSWHRWSTAALVAYAFLAVVAALERDTPDNDTHPGLIPLTCHELLRLLRLLILPRPRRDTEHVLHWSTWRRRHQHQARQLNRPGFDGDIEDPEGSRAWLHPVSTPRPRS